MTNRSKAKKGKKALKLLDLSFEGPGVENLQTAQTNGTGQSQTQSNGGPGGKYRVHAGPTGATVPRPHGGHRGTKTLPLSPYTFNKSASYQHQLQADMDRVCMDEAWSRPPSASPGWAIELTSEPNHSGESPLFIHNFLASSRVEQKLDLGNQLQDSRNGKKRPLSANDVSRFYRPNSMHQYLTTTELKNASKAETDVRLGKPTRTTLLRARQRCNSSSQNAYEQRRELLKQAEKRMETRRSLTPSYSMSELIGLDLSNEESMHSFLIGARYNRAHFLDAKSLIMHGVYMPRGNPQGCFMIHRNKYNSDDNEEMPQAAPDSPLDSDSDVDPCSSQIDHQPLQGPPPQRPPSPIPQPAFVAPGVPKLDAYGQLCDEEEPQAAWDDATGTLDVDRIDDSADKDSTHEESILAQIISLDDGLNIKGHRFNNSSVNAPAPSPRFRNGRSLSARSGAAAPPTHVIVLPSVTGTSISKTSRARETADQAPRVTVAAVPRPPSSRASRHTQDDVTEVKVEKEAKIMADKSFNVPSINGDEPPHLSAFNDVVSQDGDEHPAPFELANLDQDANSRDGQVLQHSADVQTEIVEDPEGGQEMESAAALERARGRRSKVRFQDEVTQDNLKEQTETNPAASECLDNGAQGETTENNKLDMEGRDAASESVVFFITEDDDGKVSQGTAVRIQDTESVDNGFEQGTPEVEGQVHGNGNEEQSTH